MAKVYSSKKNYYKSNKEAALNSQKAYKAKIRKKKLDNIKNGRPENEGIPPSFHSKKHEEYQKSYLEKKKEEQQAKIARRQYKADWWRKNKEAENQAKIDAYNKEFGYE